MVVTDIKTGAARKIHYSTEWLNHLQASPADPHRLLFCHEGAWHQVDRTWTIRTDGTELKLMHKRTMPYEIAGHEFFGYDGRWVWYDLQTPRSKEFWLAAISGGEVVDAFVEVVMQGGQLAELVVALQQFTLQLFEVFRHVAPPRQEVLHSRAAISDATTRPPHLQGEPPAGSRRS